MDLVWPVTLTPLAWEGQCGGQAGELQLAATELEGEHLLTMCVLADGLLFEPDLDEGGDRK